MYQFYSWDITILFRAEDRDGRYLLCFPCGYCFKSTDNMLAHLSKSEDHLLGATIPIDLVFEIDNQKEWLNERSPRNAIA